jgi:glutathione S-transferase
MSDQLDELEGQLSSSGGPWICGHQFTLADVGMMVIFDRLNEGDWLAVFTSSRVAVHAYWEALQSRESYIKGCQNHNHPLVLTATEKIKKLKKEGQWPL